MQVLIATGDPAEPFKPVEVSEAIESLAHHQVKFQARLEALEKVCESGEKTGPKLETADQFREAIGVLAVAVTEIEGVQMVTLAREQTLLREIVQRILDERKKLVELVEAFDIQVKTIAALMDYHQTALEKIGAISPRPKGSTDVN